VLCYGASLALEFVALVVLRVREPGLPRPFRVPGGLVGAALIGVPPMALLLLALWRTSPDEAGWALWLGLGLVAAGPGVYLLRRKAAVASAGAVS
jgi:amino acid transporter